MDKKMILVTRPSHDYATSILFYLSGKLFSKIEKVDEYGIINLTENKVIRSNFEKALKTNPRLVILNGHGSQNQVYGHGFEEVILDEHNMHLLDSKIIYAVACDSAQQLGELSVEVGKAEAYIGYELQFMISSDPSKSTTPSKDENIVPFERIYCSMILGLIAGLSVNDSIKKTQEMIIQLIRQYGVSAIKDKYGDAPLIRFALYWDFVSLKYFGSGDAKF